MRLAVASAVAVLLVAGCSSGSASVDQAGAARMTLQQDVDKLVALAAHRQYVPARGWLQQVQQDVMYARSTGAIGLAQEDRIAALVQRVQVDLAAAIDALAVPSASASPSRSSASRPAPSHTAVPRPAAAPIARSSAAPVRHRAPVRKQAATRKSVQHHPARRQHHRRWHHHRWHHHRWHHHRWHHHKRRHHRSD